MKRFFYTGLLILICKTTTWAQTGSDLYWTWMKGNKYATTIPHYGAKGIPADENLPPARYAAATWTDAQGIFWLFGGSRSNSLMYNDLWNFNPVTRQWTWVAGDSIPNQYGDFGTQGQASPDNRPAARQHAMAWIDDRQHLWMFGGNYNYNGVEYGMYGDLWKFDLRIQQWIWVNGSRTNNARPRLGSRTVPNPNNYPGAAYMASTWIDLQGRCWMYGGGAYNETGTQPTWTNRLWMFDPVTEIWTWMKGDARGFDTSFGIQQVPSASNCPGQRLMATTWTDVRGQLWLFGGELADGRKGNDLWKFDIRTNNWIWMKGSVPPPLINDYWPAQYGVRDLPASANNPGSRQGAAGWTNGNDKLFLFGGLGTITEHNLGHLNDLWSYDIPTNTWTWLKGDSSIVAPGDYGIFLQPDINNAPPGRSMVAAWKDLSGNNWLFGGESYLADVWRLSGTGFTDSTTVRLSGRAFGDDVQLNWESSPEWGTRFYELQHSLDRVQFDSIYRTAALGGLQMPNQYAYLDTTTQPGLHYYRLKVSQRYGQFFYSDTIAIAIGKPAQGAIIFPNPTQSILFYQSNDSTEAKWQVQVLDALGHKLIEKAWINYSGALQSLNVAALPVGVYFLRVLKPGQIQHFRFVKM